MDDKLSEIHDLVRAADLEGLRRLLDNFDPAATGINVSDQFNESPLFAAVNCDGPNAEIVRTLLEAGAYVGFVKITESPLGQFRAKADTFLSAAGIKLPAFQADAHQESAVSRAVKTGSLEIVQLFERFGANLRYTDCNGYNAILDAVYSSADPLPVVEYLLSIGVSPNGRSKYGEVPVLAAVSHGNFKLAALLIDNGADEEPIGWTRLGRAAALGTLEDVEGALQAGATIDAWNKSGFTALQMALRRGSEEIVEALLAAGASVKKRNENASSSLHCAIEGGKPSLVLRMLAAGCPVDETDIIGTTALGAAAAAGKREIVKLLLDRGANPTMGSRFESIPNVAKDRETLLLLLEAGADPGELDHEGRRKLVGLGKIDTSPLTSVTKEQYMAGRFERQGRANPENITDPFRIAMIRCGANAYRARDHFGDDPTFACNRDWKSRPPQVWCFERFGQSFTLMPDGRTILVAGEHEDSYDPDFCIYNDVTVFGPDGEITVFGYPYEVFEPTDFHTATLAGKHIWILGGLGYPDQRKGPIPVYRLDTMDYSIERISTTGDVPPRIHRQRAVFVEGSIVVTGGSAISFRGRKENHSPNERTYALDLETRIWRRD